MIAEALDTAARYPRITSIVGSIYGWISFDMLRAAQISAALLAGLVSLCSLILILPKVIEQLKIWFRKKK